MDKKASKQAAHACINRLHSISLTHDDALEIINEVIIHSNLRSLSPIRADIENYRRNIKKTSAMGPTMKPRSLGCSRMIDRFLNKAGGMFTGSDA